MGNKVSFFNLKKMAQCLMTKEQIKSRLNLSEKEYQEMIARFPELSRRQLGSTLAGNGRRKNTPKMYLDISYLNVWGNKEGVAKMRGKGLLYATYCPDYAVQHMSVADLYKSKDEILVVCGTENKAKVFRQQGFKVSTYLPSTTMKKIKANEEYKYDKRKRIKVKIHV